MIDSKDARTALAQVILEKIRQDKYPSYTQMTIFEEIAPREMARDYLNVLLAKVLEDRFPSTTMLRRIERVSVGL